VSLTDVLQGFLMLVALVVVPVIAIWDLGGIGGAIRALAEAGSEGSMLSVTGGKSFESFLLGLFLPGLAWGLGYPGQPHILARFMAIRSADRIKRARHIAMVWVIISLTCAVMVGIIGRVYLKTFLSGVKSETVFMELVNALTPPLLAGILLAAILAAIMSTADSQLLVTSSAITEDFYRVLFRKKAGNKELLWVGRLAVLAVAAIAYVIALDPDSSVLGLVAYAWGGFGAAFGPLVLISLFWKRMTRNGALAGIVVGGLTVLIWKHLQGGLFDMYEIVPGFLFSCLTIFTVSLLDRPPAQSILDEFHRIHPPSSSSP
jgi:sodium/proline symporter